MKAEPTFTDEQLEYHVHRYFANKTMKVRGADAPMYIAKLLIPGILFSMYENSPEKTQYIKARQTLLAERIKPTAAPYMLSAIVKGEN